MTILLLFFQKMSIKHQKVITISLVGKGSDNENSWNPEDVKSNVDSEDAKSEQIIDEKNASVTDVIIQSFTEYCDYSSIIGLKYLGERRRPFIEKYVFFLNYGLFSEQISPFSEYFGFLYSLC